MTAEPTYTRAPASASSPARVPARIGTTAAARGGTSSSSPQPKVRKPLPAWPWLDFRPPSLREVLEYTRAGDWVPGIAPRAWELLGMAYGYVVAAPVTAVLALVTWLIARPSRVFGAAVVVSTVWLVWRLQP